jgi:hypothetical protein
MEECNLANAKAIYKCFWNMTQSNHTWKYYQLSLKLTIPVLNE